MTDINNEILNKIGEMMDREYRYVEDCARNKIKPDVDFLELFQSETKNLMTNIMNKKNDKTSR